MTLKKLRRAWLHDPEKNDHVPLAGGGMTLQIGWLHHLEKITRWVAA
jgi:hypothetical protein